MIGLWFAACSCSEPHSGPATSSTEPPVEGDDLDGDGFTPSENDCDDTDPDIHPGAEDTPSDGLDADCDGTDLFAVDLSEHERLRIDGTTQDEGLGGSVACSSEPVGPFGSAVSVGADMFYSDTDDRGYVLVLDGVRSGRLSPTQADWRVEGENNDELGFRVVFPGDTDGDGDGELLVTAIKAYRPDAQTGAAFVFDVAAPGLQTTQDATAWIVGSEGGAMLGGAAEVGDVDGDGLDDLLISDTFLNWAARPGEVRLYAASGLSQEVPAQAALSRWVGEDPWTPTGYAMVVHELTGDGLDDLALGEHEWNGGLGRALIHPGPLAAGPFTAALSLEGAPGDGAAASRLAAGDLDGDGLGDLGLGAHTSDERRGRAHVFFGPIDSDRPLASSEVTLRGESPHAWFGGGLAVLDVDGDGLEDLAVAAPSDLLGPPRPGLIYLFHGPLSPGDSSAATADRIYRGIEPYELLGRAMAGCDLDGDGRDELVIGAAGAARGISGSGRLLVVHSL